jgi:O-acetyl-ADP-ribose deacetylase (regulator of RNase III)
MVKTLLGDITSVKGYNIIVNAANNTLLGGGGVDGAIHRIAGKELLQECRLLNGCDTGKSKITGAYKLPCDYIIHTVGPIWKGGNNKEDQLLKSCYESVLDIAVQYKVKRIAFPSISTGKFGYPIGLAAEVACKTVISYQIENNIYNEIEVTWVFIDNKTKNVYDSVLKSLENGIEYI